MPRLPKCKYCNKEIGNKTNAVKKSNGYFHIDCYNQFKKEKEKKKTDYEKLIDYLYELYDGQIPVFVFKQIKDYKTEYGMKDSGMLLCLKYCFEELGIQFDNDNGIGILIYYYDKCKKEWLHKQEINKAVDEFEFEDKEVVVKRKNTENDYSIRMKNRFNVEDI